MNKINLTVSVDNDDKESFNALVSELGLNISAAINMFIKQSIRNQALPLDLSLNKKEKGNTKSLEKISDEIMDKYDIAFKELAK
ncbi:type II toxin-antitoxin system RelB/DinJ family antitoxin [Peptoniphilus phoceensis]|uniref:type II toxin-antitoxin system RelB/DinJ family antitoxin n=1 Tax=Peptoniphilus phoceensis TaxID=1720298 RepID=UPI00078368A2|nr:type II toxin-antitoxin system RelB/DinJ family antitoxin [Peptoniphilus phoceensis]